jgi:hypothetical protein
LPRAVVRCQPWVGIPSMTRDPGTRWRAERRPSLQPWGVAGYGGFRCRAVRSECEQGRDKPRHGPSCAVHSDAFLDWAIHLTRHLSAGGRAIYASEPSLICYRFPTGS